jgi:hypothetical protein
VFLACGIDSSMGLPGGGHKPKKRWPPAGRATVKGFGHWLLL